MKNMSSSEGTANAKNKLGVKPFMGTNLGEKQWLGICGF
jgi:hypothetical protein